VSSREKGSHDRKKSRKEGKKPALHLDVHRKEEKVALEKGSLKGPKEV